MGLYVGSDCPEVRQVWAWSLDEEFELLAAAAQDEAGVILALDTEFPGLLLRDNGTIPDFERYRILRENVDTLRLIQLGLALAGPDGMVRGAWSFNLRFDVAVDLHSEPSVQFLREAGIDFERHAAEGIDPGVLGRKLASSHLVGWGWDCRSCCAPLWVTFSGDYDLGFLVKLLSVASGRRLPGSPRAFEQELELYCPRRLELRDRLPRGSLEKLAANCGIRRFGAAHTAGSDALLTLGLYLHLSSFPRSCFDEWLEPAWCSQKLWDLQAAWAGAGYGPQWEPPLPVWPRPARQAEAALPPGGQAAHAAAWAPSLREEVVEPRAPRLKELAPPPAPSTSSTTIEASPGAELNEVPEASEQSSEAASSPSSSPMRGCRTKAAAGNEPQRPQAVGEKVQGGSFVSMLRASVCGRPDSLVPPPVLCLLHLALLCVVFPASRDTLLFLPLQVAIVFLLCFSGLVPRPPQNFLSAYLAGSCARLLVLLIWMAWQGCSRGLRSWSSSVWAL